MKRKVGLGGEDLDLMATDIRKGTAMHLNRRRFLLMSTTAVLVLPAYAQSTAGPADKIYTGGDIVTISDAQPTAEAVAVKDGLILALVCGVIGFNYAVTEGLNPEEPGSFRQFPEGQGEGDQRRLAFDQWAMADLRTRRSGGNVSATAAVSSV